MRETDLFHALRPWLKDKFRDAAVIALLLALLRRYHIRAYNLGGQSALAFLELSGTFNLTDATYLQQLSDRSDMLTEQDTDESLIDTTINDLTVAVPQARDNEIGMLLALAAYIDNRAKQRTVLIERYERPWAVGEALNHTYQNNGIRYKMYDKNILACKEICEPWHGRVVEISGEYSTIIPQHPGCDCLWQPIRQNGQRLGNPPVVVNVPGLEPWQAPATPWTGGSR